MAGSLDDLEAINRYIMETPLKNPAAGKVRNRWLEWHDGLTFVDKYAKFDATYDKARNFRNEFNLANTVTDAEKKVVKDTMKTGLSSEQTAGLVDRRNTEGGYLEEAQPWIPAQYKVAIIVGSVALGALFVYGLSTAIPAAAASYAASRRLKPLQSV